MIHVHVTFLNKKTPTKKPKIKHLVKFESTVLQKKNCKIYYMTENPLQMHIWTIFSFDIKISECTTNSQTNSSRFRAPCLRGIMKKIFPLKFINFNIHVHTLYDRNQSWVYMTGCTCSKQKLQKFKTLSIFKRVGRFCQFL